MNPRAILFDLDGTLTRPIMDFDALRRAMGLGQTHTILEEMARLEQDDPARHRRLLEILHQFEHDAAQAASANHGAAEVMADLHRRGVAVAIVTRNARASTQATLRRIGLTVEALVTREDATPKPAPDPVLLACERLGVPPGVTWMVGDYVHDIVAGQAAGCAATVLITNGQAPDFDHAATHVIHHLPELLTLLDG